MKFYNTLTRTKDEFVPMRDDKQVRIYSCGPTVYGFAHIGNMRTYIFMDYLRRALQWNGYTLLHTMNITDVGHLVNDADSGEDKMNKTAREQKKTPWEIAKFYTEIFMRDIKKLNIQVPEIVPKATEHIPEMISFVEGLIEKGYGYETSDGIYYDIKKFKDYGRLSRMNFDENQAGARVEVNSEKHHPADFALWKKADPSHIMQWESPWGMGFPGWHIECSAMGLKYLGEEFDIHTGGVDHIPIHHENEIAQTCGLLGHPAAKWWMHGEFMLVDGGKMSKSLGNTYTLDQLEEKGYSPMVFRYFCSNAHYRQKLNFTFDGMDSAKKSLKNLKGLVAKHKGADGKVDKSVLDGFLNEFSEAVNDDLNIPKALGTVWNMARYETKSNDLYELIMKCDTILGLDLDKQEEEKENSNLDEKFVAEINEQIAKRAEAKKAKNYAEADRIRNELAEKGITLIDTANGTTFKVN